MSIPLVTASGYIKGRRLIVRDRKAFDAAVAELKDGWEVELEIRRLRATRSQKQNRYHWGVVMKMISGETGYTREEIHDLMKMKFLSKELAFLDGNGEVVEQYVLGGSTRGLDTKEFSEFDERIKEWAAGPPLNLYIPDPNEAGYGVGI